MKNTNSCQSVSIKPPKITKLLTIFCLSLLYWSGSASTAELPVLGQAGTLSGQATSAHFFAGASRNGTEVFTTSFHSQDLITLKAEIHVEPEHVNRIGNLYIILYLDGHFFMRTSNGSYQLWDVQLSTLLPAADSISLKAIEPLTILENLEVGFLGLSGQQISILFAYDLETAPNELYYSGSPLSFTFEGYDPLLISQAQPEVMDTSFIDGTRDREIPLLIFLPEAETPRPLILFSHGLGSSRFTAKYLGNHWAARGYVVAFMQHAGSDASILYGVPLSHMFFVMSQAASANNAIARIDDVNSVIDQFELWNVDSSHSLYTRIDSNRIAMSGHSFGARTTQAVSGEDIQWIFSDTREPRIKAAMPLSVSSPDLENSIEIFKNVDIPWLVMTGTKDISVVGDTTIADRLAVFPALPPDGKYELILSDGQHHAFTDRPVSAFQNPRNPAHHTEIMALSTAFWDAWLSGYPDALVWLNGDAAKAILQPGDSWQFK